MVCREEVDKVSAPVFPFPIYSLFISRRITMSLFPDPRRIVTGHDGQGNAIVLRDSRIKTEPSGFNANFAVLWETDRFPANNNGGEDPADKTTQSLANKNGVVLRVVDFPPNTPTVSQ